MATLARCRISPPPPDFPRCLPARLPRAHCRTQRSSEYVVLSSSHQREKKSTPHSKGCIRILVTSSCNSMPYIPSTFGMVDQEDADSIKRKMSVIGPMIVECASDHQSSFVTNALLLTLPCEALAETCVPSDSFFNMPLLLTIALIGATVGGLLARQRRGELKQLNDQLRQINEALRREAKIESYVPVNGMPEAEVTMDPRKEQLITILRSGKNFLRNQQPEEAFLEFKKALDLARSLGEQIEEKKAARGLGTSLQRQGKFREAIKHHSKVLEIAKRSGEDSGCTEAYGAIADCYTELGDLEQAGKFYDKYIARLKSD